MRISRFFSAFLAIFLSAALGACGAGADPEGAAAGIQADFAAAGQVLFTADIRADYGDRVYDFGVSVSSDAAGGVMTVSEPEIIAGVTVRRGPGSPLTGRRSLPGRSCRRG